MVEEGVIDIFNLFTLIYIHNSHQVHVHNTYHQGVTILIPLYNMDIAFSRHIII